jgi:hypothetical protein
MGSHRRAARWERRQFRRLTKDLDLDLDTSTIGGVGEAQRPGRQPAKDFLGAAATLAIIGVILLQVTYGLDSRCRTNLNSRRGAGACSGMAAVAHHAKFAVTLSVAACGALAVIAFVWYLLWGYKTNGQTS